MKQLTLTNDFFKNECAESFCKAILNNKLYDKTIFRGFDSRDGETAFIYESKTDADLGWDDSITFKIDDSFKVDWACLAGTNIKLIAYTIDSNELPMEIKGTMSAFCDNHDIRLHNKLINYELESISKDELELDLEHMATIQGVTIEAGRE